MNLVYVAKVGKYMKIKLKLQQLQFWPDFDFLMHYTRHENNFALYPLAYDTELARDDP